MKTTVMFLVIVATAFASINIASPIDGYAYFAGEKIQVLGSADTTVCSGTLELFLDGQKISEKTFEPGQTIDLSSFNAELSPSPGQHYIDVTNTCLGARSTSFSVKNSLQIIHSTTATRAMTGDAINVTAYAFKRARIDGITRITAEGVTSVDSFTMVFSTPGEKIIEFDADDGLGNTGSSSMTIEVFDVLNVQATLSKTLAKPGETITANVTVKDALSQERSAEITAAIEKISAGKATEENEIYAEATVSDKFATTQTSSSSINVVVPADALGQYKILITAANGSNRGSASADFAVARMLIIKKIIIERDYVKIVAVDQTGAPFDTATNVTLLDENGNAVWTREVETNAVVETNFTGLPDGPYSISAGEATELFSAADINPPRNTMTGYSLAGQKQIGAGVLSLAALGATAYLLKKKSKNGL